MSRRQILPPIPRMKKLKSGEWQILQQRQYHHDAEAHNTSLHCRISLERYECLSQSNCLVTHVIIAQNFTTLLKAQLLFNAVSISVNSLHPPLNKRVYSHPVQVALPLQPLVHGILQCLITGVKVLSRDFSQRSKKVRI
jgi:hypothetical protein